MSEQQNKELMRRYYDEVWGKGDLKAADELVAEDVVDHMPLPGQGPGRAGHNEAVKIITSAFPDRQFTYHHLIAEGDKVVGHWSMTGTHQGELIGIPATGKPVTMTGMDMLRWENGKVAEIWHIEDVLGMLQQIGAVPGPERG